MGTTSTAGTFAEKFEEALRDLREREPGYGLRTLARTLAKDDHERIETIRRRLNKYRPKPGGGAAEVAPTEPTRHEIEKAMGLEQDALRPEHDDRAAADAQQFLSDLAPLRRLWDIGQKIERGELVAVASQSNGPTTPLAGSAAGPSTRRSLDDGDTDV